MSKVMIYGGLAVIVGLLAFITLVFIWNIVAGILATATALIIGGLAVVAKEIDDPWV